MSAALQRETPAFLLLMCKSEREKVDSISNDAKISLRLPSAKPRKNEDDLRYYNFSDPNFFHLKQPGLCQCRLDTT